MAKKKAAAKPKEREAVIAKRYWYDAEARVDYKPGDEVEGLADDRLERYTAAGLVATEKVTDPAPGAGKPKAEEDKAAEGASENK